MREHFNGQTVLSEVSESVVEMRTYWGDYPLDYSLTAVKRRFTLGPFQGQLNNGLVRLHAPGMEQHNSCTVETSHWVTVSLGHATYNFHISKPPPRLPRLASPGWPLIVALLFSVVFVAFGLCTARAAVPNLAPMVRLASDEVVEIPFPARSLSRPLSWAAWLGYPESTWGPIGPYERPLGNEFRGTDCRTVPLSPCPRGIQAWGVEKLKSLPDSQLDDVVVEGRLGLTEDGSTAIYPTKLPIRQRKYALLLQSAAEIWAFGETVTTGICGKESLARRVLVRGAFRLEHLAATNICAVVPGTEPSTRPASRRAEPRD